MDLDRAPCLEISLPKRDLCARPYAQGLDAWGPRRLGALGAWAPEGLGKALPPPSKLLLPTLLPSTSQNKPLCYDSQLCWRFRPLLSPSSLLRPPSSLLLPPAKPYARPYARCEFDGSGLCWRSRPFVPPPSVLPPSSCPLPAPLSLFYLKQAPMRSLCRPMRAPYARDTILIEFRSCTLLRNHSCA